MKAIKFSKFVAPLLVGGALLVTALPGMAHDSRQRYYGAPPAHAKAHGHKVKHAHHQRGHHKHVQYKHKRVVHHHYVKHTPRYAYPRTKYSYDPSVVVRIPPIVINLR